MRCLGSSLLDLLRPGVSADHGCGLPLHRKTGAPAPFRPIGEDQTRSITLVLLALRRISCASLAISASSRTSPRQGPPFTGLFSPASLDRSPAARVALLNRLLRVALTEPREETNRRAASRALAETQSPERLRRHKRCGRRSEERLPRGAAGDTRHWCRSRRSTGAHR